MIESLILGLPVPEIVLAEHPTKRKSFIVIDGKQRLLTIAGFISPNEIPYWRRNKLEKLTQLRNLNGIEYKTIDENESFADEKREFLNADIRCTVISNYKETDVLYDIFYRLNVGSSPLSTQELRQVLNKGEFADYLYEATQEYQLLHKVMGLDGADSRLRDLELLLRIFAIKFYGDEYKGNLKKFLDDSMKRITENWGSLETKIKESKTEIDFAIKKLIAIFGENNVGRKFINGKYEQRFNRVLFEVQVFFFLYLIGEELIGDMPEKLKQGFQRLCDNPKFRSTLESSTKNMAAYVERYDLFREFVANTLNKSGSDMPHPFK